MADQLAVHHNRSLYYQTPKPKLELELVELKVVIIPR